jgi:hypothetical protein
VTIFQQVRPNRLQICHRRMNKREPVVGWTTHQLRNDVVHPVVYAAVYPDAGPDTVLAAGPAAVHAVDDMPDTAMAADMKLEERSNTIGQMADDQHSDTGDTDNQMPHTAAAAGIELDKNSNTVEQLVAV